ncbi:MAG: hypothetical protein EXQ55_10720 [Acidobacteria bacterium]|nr:hypothetical protein [Acidobacteriota bacterium]
MPQRLSRHSTRALLVAGGLIGALPCASAQTPVESSSEARFQLDLHVPDSALATLLPAGWTLNVAAQGPAKDANLRAVFIDRVSINGPDGKPVGKGSNRLVYLVAPVKDPAGAAVQLVIGGLTEDPADAPEPFGVYLPATTHTMQRSTTSGAGPILESQDWAFATATGERLEMHIKYERGVGNRGNPSDTKFYSAKNPSFYQISRQEQVLDILRNVTTTPPDRVREFSFRGSGGRYAKLFEGAQKLGYGDRFRQLDLAVTFDPKWNYDLPNAHDPSMSKTFVNAEGREQGTCVHLGNCDVGCDVNARNTLDLNYLARAEKKGAEIRPLRLVRAIASEAGTYRVTFDRIDKGALIAGSLTARIVIVAAGSIGSTELLLRSRDLAQTLPNLSRFLGHNWSSN